MPSSHFGKRHLTAAVTVTAVLIAGLVGSGPASAAPAAPSGLSPTSGAAVSTNTPTFSWNRVSGAAKYEVQTDADSNFGSPVKATTFNRRWVPTAALPTGVNYWRVRAIGIDGTSSAWAELFFSVGLRNGPTLKAVTPNPLPQPTNPPLLEWSTVPGATSYEIEVATEDQFLEPTKYTTSTTAFVVPTPAASEQYFWRVRGVLGAGIVTKWSDPFGTYAIGDLQNVPTESPDEGEALEDVVLDWEPVPGAVYYELRVGLDPDLNTWEEQVLNVRGTRYSPSSTYANNDGWYWKVRAVNAKQERIPWASVPLRTFQRHWPDTPDLVHPANTINPAVGDDFYYQWTPVQHATHYELWMGIDPNFSPGTYDICKTAATTYTAGHLGDACMPSQGQVSYWRVRAIDLPTNVPGIFSETRSFIYNSGPVTKISPTNGAIVAVPTLKWQAQREVEKYHVVVEGTGGYSLGIETYALSWTPNLDPTKGPFTWKVWAEDFSGSESPIYAGWTFTLSGSPADTAEAPLTPLTGTAEDAPTTRFPTLSWEPMDGAAYYKVHVGVHGSGFEFSPSTTQFLTTRFNFPAATDPGKVLINPPVSYDWWVEAFNAANTSIGVGPVDTYTISDLPTVTGRSIALTGTSLDADAECDNYLDDPDPTQQKCTAVPTTPVLDWDPVPGASHYMVYLAEERELTTIIYDGIKTGNTRWTPVLSNSPRALPDNTSNKAYYWIIRPCKASGICAPDPISTDASATNAFTKLSPPVVLQSPANGALIDTGLTTDAGEVTFTWQDYFDTNLATTYSTTGETSTQTAQTYKIEVSENDTFAPLVDTATVDQTTYTPWKETYPEGRLYWRVQAIDAQGNLLNRSPVWSFTKSGPATTLVSPGTLSTTNGLMPFRWAPAKGALDYSLEVYRNGDTTFSSANRVFTCRTPQTACTSTKPIPASSLEFVWRVRWYDGDSDAMPWSQAGKFYSKGQAPTLNSPLAGEQVNAVDSYFTWTAPPGDGATSFKFERKLSSSASVAETITTTATAYAPLAKLSDGTWQWRVTALDASKAPLGSSAWRTFVVPSSSTSTGGGSTNARPTVTSIRPAAGAKVRPGVNFRATFSEQVTNVTTRTVKLFRQGSSTPVRARVTLSADKRSVVLNPSSNLRRGRVYVMKVTASVRDLTGLSLYAKSWKVTVRR